MPAEPTDQIRIAAVDVFERGTATDVTEVDETQITGGGHHHVCAGALVETVPFPMPCRCRSVTTRLSRATGPFPRPIAVRKVATGPHSSAEASSATVVVALRPPLSHRHSAAYVATTSANDRPQRCRKVSPWLWPWSERTTKS